MKKCTHAKNLDTIDLIVADDAYKNKCKEYCLKAIQDDIEWYSSIFRKIGIVNEFIITKGMVGYNVVILWLKYFGYEVYMIIRGYQYRWGLTEIDANLIHEI